MIILYKNNIWIIRQKLSKYIAKLTWHWASTSRGHAPTSQKGLQNEFLKPTVTVKYYQLHDVVLFNLKKAYYETVTFHIIMQKNKHIKQTIVQFLFRLEKLKFQHFTKGLH